MSDTTITMRGLAGSVPELKISTNNLPWTTFRLASTPSRRTPEGDWVERPTMWVTVKVFRRLAEHVVSTVRKGMPLTVVGSLVQDEWIGTDGQQREDLVIEARSVALDLQGSGTFIWKRGDQRIDPRAGESAHTAAERPEDGFGSDPGPIDDLDDDAAGHRAPRDISDLVEAEESAPF